jgi:hypothetical protein
LCEVAKREERERTEKRGEERAENEKKKEKERRDEKIRGEKRWKKGGDMSFLLNFLFLFFLLRSECFLLRRHQRTSKRWRRAPSSSNCFVCLSLSLAPSLSLLSLSRSLSLFLFSLLSFFLSCRPFLISLFLSFSLSPFSVFVFFSRSLFLSASLLS